jgi:hypothetical protein
MTEQVRQASDAVAVSRPASPATLTPTVPDVARGRRGVRAVCCAVAAGFVLLAGVLVGLICGILWYESRLGWTPTKVERITNAACPPGLTRGQVQAWLDTDPFLPEPPGTFHFIAKGPSAPSSPARLTYHYVASVKDIGYMAREVGLSEDDLGGAILAEVPDANVDPICAGTITVVFFFDKDDRLIRTYVRVWIQSL